MKSRTELSMTELYALERTARLARTRELGRLIRAGADALARGVDTLIRLASHAVTMPDNGKEISHA